MLTGDSEPDLMSDMSLPQQVQMREIMESPAYTGRISAMSRLFGGRNLPGVYSPRYDGFTLALRLCDVYIPLVLKMLWPSVQPADGSLCNIMCKAENFKCLVMSYSFAIFEM